MLPRDRAVDEIVAEAERQDDHWGENRQHSDLEWRVILGEEIGELDKQLVTLLAYSANHSQAAIDANVPLIEKAARKELIQALAVGLQWLEAMDRRATVIQLKTEIDRQAHRALDEEESHADV